MNGENILNAYLDPSLETHNASRGAVPKATKSRISDLCLLNGSSLTQNHGFQGERTVEETVVILEI